MDFDAVQRLLPATFPPSSPPPTMLGYFSQPIEPKQWDNVCGSFNRFLVSWSISAQLADCLIG